jgi:hypothetical protein
VCHVSLRPAGRVINAAIVEAAEAATDIPSLAGFALLVDEPATANETLAAFVGQVLKEAANAGDTVSAGMKYAVLLDAPASAAETANAYFGMIGVVSAVLSEAATATDVLTAIATTPGKWTLVDSWTYSSDVAQVTFIGLAGHTDVRVVFDGVMGSAAFTVRQLRVSTNNGSTFLSSSGDYVSVSSAGVEANEDRLFLTSSGNAGPLSGEFVIAGWNLAAIKQVESRHRIDSSYQIIPTTSALNALQITNSAGNLTGGSIYIFAR